MKTLMKTFVFAMTVVLAGVGFAADHGHGDPMKLGEQKSKSWSVAATQFGKLNADSKEIVLTLVISSNGGDLSGIEAFRFWFGDADSESMVNKIDGSLHEGKIYIHGHLPIEKGDDYSQFTLEVDDGSEDGELITFKTK